MSTSISGTSSSSSATAASSPTSVSGVTRYMGLASGLDVDSIVKGLMTADQHKIDIQQQQQQTLQWKQSAYQSITSSLQTFKSTYLDFLGGSSSMVSSGNFESFSGTSSNSILSASGTVGAQLGNHVVDVYQSAVTNTVTGSVLSSSITGNVDTRTLNAANLQGTSFIISVDGVTKNISFASTDDFSNIGTLVNSKLKSAFGTDVSKNCKVAATVDSNGYLTMQSNGGYQSLISVSSAAKNDALSTLGISSGASNRINSGLGSDYLTAVKGSKSALAIDTTGLSFNLTLTSIATDGARTSTLSTVSLNTNKTYTDNNELQKDLQTAIDTSTGATGIVTVSVDSDGIISLNTQSNSIAQVNTTDGSQQAIDNLAKLGLTDGAKTITESGSSLQELFGGKLTGVQPDGSFSVNINGTDVKLNSNENVTQTLNRINTANAGATASYNNLTDQITFTATQGGAAGSVALDDKGTGLFDNLLGTSANRTAVDGKDAIVAIDGIKVTRDNNSFSINGLNLTINGTVDGNAPPQTSNITLTNDVSKTVTLIGKFVDAYNKVITDANNLITQKPDPNYKALTDAQKSTMTADAITKWEAKAQQGVIFSDPNITKILTQMRQMLDSPVTATSGKTMYLSDIGITTGNYTEAGQLHVDTTKLTNALQKSPDDVMQIFTKTSTVPYSTTGSNQSQRLSEEGFSNRLQDIVSNASGFKGTLLQLAGMPNDSTTQTTNALYLQLNQLSTTIKNLQTQYTTDQTKYYNQFIELETYMSKMNAQSSQIQGMFSSSSGG
jgi:flagellar hook-associated protein 2